MKIYIINHTFHYEMENLTRVFFPNDKIEVITEHTENYDKPCIITEAEQGENGSSVSVICSFEEYEKKLEGFVSKDTTDYKDEQERLMAVLLYKILCDYTKITPPWGILTGVRPIKLMRTLIDEKGREYAKDYFKNALFVSEEKTSLALKTEANERKILALSKDNSFSLYVSIPFCPSRCSYCSFVSQSIEKASHLIQPYVEKLCEEIAYTGSIADKLGLKLESVYIGGGTPTALNANQLARLIKAINSSFNMNECREFTVEAGRPDTITEEKLFAIKSGGADRISINPQTLNDSVLEQIGRKHTAKQAVDAFLSARNMGFNHINTDLIAGLPGDTPESFENTLNGILSLAPESITVHTLAMKRSSRLSENRMELYRKDASAAAEMQSFCCKLLPENGYIPYYLYRQSKMVGNLENVGWSLEGYEGLYNVYVMDETHTVLGCGAGAVTKLKQPNGKYLERIFNYKYPYEYLNGFEQMLIRKERFEPFYELYGK